MALRISGVPVCRKKSPVSKSSMYRHGHCALVRTMQIATQSRKSRKSQNHCGDLVILSPVLISDQRNSRGHRPCQCRQRARLDIVPVVRLSRFMSAESVAYNLADNRLAEFGRINLKLLAVQLEELTVWNSTKLRLQGSPSATSTTFVSKRRPRKKPIRSLPRVKTASQGGAAARKANCGFLAPSIFSWGCRGGRGLPSNHRLPKGQDDLREPVSDFRLVGTAIPKFESDDRVKSNEKFTTLLATFLRLAEQASSLGATVSVVLDSQTQGAMP